MGKKIVWLSVLLALAVGGFLWWWTAKESEQPTFRKVQIRRGDLEVKVLANGVVQPQNRLEIKPPIPGRVESILVEEGAYITKGQALAWMSSTDRAALLDAARAKGSAELAHWEDLFKPTPLIAPLSGRLIVRNVEPGQVVTAQDPVLVMSDHLIIRVQVDETDIARIKNGQVATIRLEAYPTNEISGKVDHISFESKVVNNVTIYEVDVLPNEVPDFMRSGMTAEVEFLVERREGVLLAPAGAVRREGEKATVQVLNPQDPKKYLTRDVRVGLSDGKDVEILDGLQEGDFLRVSGFRRGPAGGSRPTSPLNPVPAGRPRR